MLPFQAPPTWKLLSCFLCCSGYKFIPLANSVNSTFKAPAIFCCCLFCLKQGFLCSQGWPRTHDACPASSGRLPGMHTEGGGSNYVLIPAASHPSHPQHHLLLTLAPLPSPDSPCVLSLQTVNIAIFIHLNHNTLFLNSRVGMQRCLVTLRLNLRTPLCTKRALLLPVLSDLSDLCSSLCSQNCWLGSLNTLLLQGLPICSSNLPLRYYHC